MIELQKISEAEKAVRLTCGDLKRDNAFSLKLMQAINTLHCGPLRKAMEDADLLEIGRQTFILWKKFNEEKKV